MGAEVLGADPELLLHADDELAAWCLDALEANGVLVFKDLHVDDAAQVAFSRTLGDVVLFAHLDPPEIFRVTLDPAKNPAADYLRGTFDWHIDGMHRRHPDHGHRPQRPRGRGVGWRDRVRQHLRRLRAPVRRRARRALEAIRVVHTIEAVPAAVQPDPPDRGGRAVALAPVQDAPAGVAAPVGPQVAGARRHHRPRRGHGPRGVARAYLADLLDRSTVPEHVYRHEWAVGDLVIWDNRGVLHRPPATTRRRPATCTAPRSSGDEAMQ